MAIKNAKELRVYQRAYKTSVEIHRISLTFPKIEQYALGDQLRRSTKSICANLAEGFNKQKYSTKEFARFLTMAEASAAEVHVWLDYAHDFEYITVTDYKRWYDEYDAVGAMINKFYRAL